MLRSLSQYGETQARTGPFFLQFAKPAIVTATFSAALICGSQSVQAQLNIPSGNAAAAPPASTEFKAGFESAGAVVQQNTGHGAGKALNLKANAGKSDAEATSADLRFMQQFLASRWDGADDKSRGYFARVTEDLTQTIQTKSHMLAPAVQTHLSDAGYFAVMPDGSDANPSKAHALMLLSDTADQLDAMNGGIAADKKKGALASATDSTAGGYVPGMSVVHLQRKANAASKGGHTAADNDFLGMIRTTTENVMTAVGVKEDDAAGAESVSAK